jgi:hypothetical protein
MPLAVVYFCIGAAFISYGAVILKETVDVVEVQKRYDNIDECRSDWRYPSMCIIDLNIDYFMNSPIFVYYEIKGMYQNHRRYAKNRDVQQLLGHDRAKHEINDYCMPVVDMSDLGFITNMDISSDDPANPCGLIAKSFFNDTYRLYKPGGTNEVEISEHGIAWDVDKEEKFDKLDSWEEDQWINVENGIVHSEHFMVWMSIAGLPDFRKLWGHIEQDLSKGVYRLLINNNYDVTGFSGEKYIVLTTTCFFGGKIEFMGVLYIIVGAIALAGMGIMLATFYIKRRYNIV